MGTLYRPSYTEFRLGDGSSRLPDGARVTKATPGAVKKSGKSAMWWGRYTDENGTEQQVKLSADKKVARAMLTQLENTANLKRAGVPIPEAPPDPLEEHAQRPLAAHLDDFRRALIAEGDTPQHARRTVNQAQVVLDGLGVADLRGLAALSVDAVADWLTDQRLDRPLPELPLQAEEYTIAETSLLTGYTRNAVRNIARRLGLPVHKRGQRVAVPLGTVEGLRQHAARGWSVATSNHHRGALKHFCRWLADRRRQRLPADPLVGLAWTPPGGDVRVQRRTLAAPQFHHLLVVTESRAGTLMGLSGPERALLYLAAARTGLRAGELRSLTPQSVDADFLFVTARRRATKNSKDAVQPLPADLARRLRAHLPTRAPGEPLWGGVWHQRAADMLLSDLEAAGIPFALDGLRYDFHALRAQYVTDLVRAGNNPADVQKLARHGDVRLTLETYTKVRAESLREAVGRLPSLDGG